MPSTQARRLAGRPAGSVQAEGSEDARQGLHRKAGRSQRSVSHATNSRKHCACSRPAGALGSARPSGVTQSGAHAARNKVKGIGGVPSACRAVSPAPAAAGDPGVRAGDQQGAVGALSSGASTALGPPRSLVTQSHPDAAVTSVCSLKSGPGQRAPEKWNFLETKTARGTQMGGEGAHPWGLSKRANARKCQKSARQSCPSGRRAHGRHREEQLGARHPPQAWASPMKGMGPQATPPSAFCCLRGVSTLSCHRPGAPQGPDLTASHAWSLGEGLLARLPLADVDLPLGTQSWPQGSPRQPVLNVPPSQPNSPSPRPTAERMVSLTPWLSPQSERDVSPLLCRVSRTPWSHVGGPRLPGWCIVWR